MIFIVSIAVIIFVAIFLLVFLFVKKGSEESARRTLGIESKQKKVNSPIVKMLRPLFTIFVPLANILQSEHQRRKRREQFVQADMTGEITPEEFLAYQIFCGTVVFFYLTMAFGIGKFGLACLLSILGFFFPVGWLLDRIKMRGESMVRELPHVVDMLSLSTRAGMGFTSGIDRLVRKRKASPLMDELAKMLQEIQMGASREDALRNMSTRCNAPEMNQFIVVLIQASSLGVPISRVLRAQSEKLRSERFQKAERIGGMATQRLVFPLVMLIMPAVFIVVLGPVILAFIYM